MQLPGIEIHDVSAMRVDEQGRVRRVRVLGVSEQRDYPVRVLLEPDMLAAGNYDVRASARWVEADAVAWHADLVAFQHHAPPAGAAPRAAYLWSAELDLDAGLHVPTLTLGALARPWRVRAETWRPDRDDDDEAVQVIHDLPLIREFRLGVLFVHGIGQQARSDTLVHWTAPILRWVNGWFDAAGRRLAERADPQDVQAWLSALVVRPDWRAHDSDSGDRYRLARSFAERALAKTFSDPAEARDADIRRSLATSDHRPLEPEEVQARDRFAAHVRNQLDADIVGGTATLADARLIDGDAPATRPSTVELRVAALAADGDVERSHWLMAESHWAESFRPPPFGAFGAWCLRSAPLLWVHYVALTMARIGSPWWRGAWALLPLATVVVLAMLGVTALLVLALVPWQRLRSALTSFQGLLAAVVGDSYVFLNDAVQGRAVVDRVRRDVEWLSQRCGQVLVVAHSQGAAVADAAVNNIHEYWPERLAGLVTLGAGIQTLDRLELLRRRKDALVWGGIGLGSACVLWAGVALAVMGSAASAAAAVGVGAIGLLLAGNRAWELHPGLSRLPRWAAGQKDWHDFHATHDPVPWGPMVSPEVDAKEYKSHQVDNRASFVADHNAYWQNAEQVVGPIAHLVARAAGTGMLERAVPDATGLLRRLGAARQARLQWLRAARWAAALCVLFVAQAKWAAVRALASWAWGTWGASPAAGGATDKAASFPGLGVLGDALCIAVPALVYTLLLSPLWASWNEVETTDSLRAQRLVPSMASLWAFAVVLTGMATWSLALGLALWGLQPWAAWAASIVLIGGLMHVLHKKRIGDGGR